MTRLSSVLVPGRGQVRRLGTNSVGASATRTNLFGKSLEGIKKELETLKQPAYRSKQIYEWMYGKGVTLLQDMTDIPKSLKHDLEPKYKIDYGSVLQNQHSVDGTRKMLIGVNNDPKAVYEAVFIPEDHRGTLCVSSQIGCSLSCRFCHTGTQKLYRNLTAAEIAGQYMITASLLGDFPLSVNQQRKVSNIVFMGQGEPLYNFRNVSNAIQLLTDKAGIGLPSWRITVSTSGVAPLIPRIAQDMQVGLAISLHSADNDLRSEIMPINKTYPLPVLMESCRDYVKLSSQQTRRITFEYVMLSGVNDSDTDAQRLVDLIKRLPAHVNLIPFNPWPSSIYTASPPARVAHFCSLIRQSGIHASVRTPRGDDILAACGQLKSLHDTKRSAEANRL